MVCVVVGEGVVALGSCVSERFAEIDLGLDGRGMLSGGVRDAATPTHRPVWQPG